MHQLLRQLSVNSLNEARAITSKLKRKPAYILRTFHCQTRSLWSTSPSRGEKGLYGVEGLHPDADALAAFKDGAVAKTETLRAQLASRGDVPSVNTVRELDEISFTLCVVLDALELCRSTHQDAAARMGTWLGYSLNWFDATFGME